MLKISTLCSGIGAPEIALRNLGVLHRIVYACDIDKNAKKTYLQNHHCEKFYDDLFKIDPKELEYSDILIAGYACQSFSIIGAKRGFLEEKDNKGQMFFQIAKIINQTRPKMVILENVKNFVSHNKGETLKTALQILDDVGYNVEYFVLNAKDFGVPQNRERVFFVCTRKDLKQNLIKEMVETYKGPAKPFSEMIDTIDNQEKVRLSDKIWESIQRHKENNIKAGRGFGYTYIDQNGTVPCMTTKVGSFDSRTQLIKMPEGNPRYLTVKECYRLQGFPEDFLKNPSDRQAYKQVGNSICVPVIETILSEVMISLGELPRKMRELQENSENSSLT